MLLYWYRRPCLIPGAQCRGAFAALAIPESQAQCRWIAVAHGYVLKSEFRRHNTSAGPGLHGGRRCVLSDPVRLGGVFWRRVAPAADSVHTSTMTLNNAASLALIGTLLLTVVVAVVFINTVLAVA